MLPPVISGRDLKPEVGVSYSDHLQCALITYVRTLQSSQIMNNVATKFITPFSGFSRGGL